MKRARPTSAGARARAWRDRLELTVEQLEEMSGYSRESIWMYERGKRSDKTEIGAFAWQRYKMACAAVDRQIRSGEEFEW